MTAPVFMPQRFSKDADGTYSMNGGSTGMMFYINTANMDVVPEPDNDAVDIDELPKFKAFVRWVTLIYVVIVDCFFFI